jgi:creatinine amidohydrolase
MLLAELAWPQVETLSRDTPVVIPVAALEQHGHHMPVYTDSLLCGEVVRRVNEQMKDRVLFTPLMWLGNSHHHMDFKGTISASPRVYIDLLHDLAEDMLHHGFKRLLFVNGHGGNIIPGRQAIFEMRQRHRDRTDLLLLFASYWDFGKLDFEKHQLFQKQVQHACEYETSMMLRLRPELVAGDIKKLQTIEAGFGYEPAYRGWTTNDRSDTGHIGSPQFATAEKGEYLFSTYAGGVAEFLEKVITWDGSRWA